jgi:hypothetical protein
MILRAYRSFSLESMANNNGDFACLVMSGRYHERRLTGPEHLEVLLDSSFPQFYAIGELFDDSMVLQFLPAGPEPPRFQILDRGFQCGHLLSLRLE